MGYLGEQNTLMNIFILDYDPKTCAQYHCDKHVVKMIVETAQLLSTAHHILNSNLSGIYKVTHENHPCAIWARQSKENYSWLCRLGLNLCYEYTHRYGKRHKTQNILELLSAFNPVASGRLTNFALAMPEECKIGNAVESYREYYIKEKSHILKFTNREKPEWI